MDPQQAFDQALTAYNNDDFNTAEILAGRLAQIFPCDLNVLKLKGVSALRQNKFQESLTSFSRAVLLTPDNSDAWLLLGKTRVHLRDYAGAIEAFSRVIELDSDNVEAHALFLLELMQGVGFNSESVRQISDRWRKEFFDGASLEEVTAIMEEKEPYRGEIRSVFRNMSNIAFKLQETELAVDLFSRSCIKIEDKAAPAKSLDDLKNAYVALAGGYEELDIHQSIPRALGDFLKRHYPDATGLRVLDAACGTGLVGSYLKPISRRLVGIDLSPDMLDHAKRKGDYDELICGDLVEEMAALEPSFDLITSSAALYHFGDLSDVFEQSARLLGPGGLFVFTVDPCADDWEMMLTNASEYAHSRRYLRGLAEKNDFAEVAIELQSHRAYPGFFCAFRKS